jgi:ClpP class serine protease
MPCRGTLIALAADEIVMDEHAVLMQIDPQLGGTRHL